jgi:hypothetical protein
VLRQQDGILNWMALNSSYHRTAQRALPCEPRSLGNKVASEKSALRILIYAISLRSRQVLKLFRPMPSSKALDSTYLTVLPSFSFSCSTCHCHLHHPTIKGVVTKSACFDSSPNFPADSCMQSLQFCRFVRSGCRIILELDIITYDAYFLV